MAFDLVKFLEQKKKFSEKTFGPGDRTKGIIAHIKKELVEIAESQSPEERLNEWVDVVLLSLDAMWRLGYSPEEISTAIRVKQLKNMNRKWPDWRTKSQDDPLEHDREYDPGMNPIDDAEFGMKP